MALLLFANNATTTISGAITNVATSVALAPGSGALFPNPGAGQQFLATLNDSATGLLSEIVLCTARATDTLTIVRAQEGTTGLAWNAGDILSNFCTAGTLAAMLQQQQVPAFPARIITANTNQTLALTDYAIGFNRTVPAAQTCTLPNGPSVGQAFIIEDIGANFSVTNTLTVIPSAGTTIAGLNNFVMNTPRQSNTFRFYGSNLWSVK
jgi:hypothetical protein